MARSLPSIQANVRALKSCWYSSHTRARGPCVSSLWSHLKRVGLLYQQSVSGKSSLHFRDYNCRVKVISVAVSWRSYRRNAEPTRAASRAKLMPLRFKCRFCASTTCCSSQTDDALTSAKWHFLSLLPKDERSCLHSALSVSLSAHVSVSSLSVLDCGAELLGERDRLDPHTQTLEILPIKKAIKLN